MSTLVPGTVFASDFRVLRPLSSGGMGAVYVVEQLSTGQQRALKIMLPSLVASEDLRRRFEQEARIGARIASEHVVQVIAAGVDPATNAPFLVMELLDGEDLEALVRRRGAIPTNEVLPIFDQLCHAVGAAHKSGIVHRDLKPENVFLAKSLRAGADFTVKVLDFGIAKIVAESAGKSTGAMGSPMWLAPEQTERGAIAPSADVWALGLIAFFLLTGRSFWRAANAPEPTVTQLLREVLFEEIGVASARAKEYGAILPAGFDGWFARCVVREATARYPDATTALLGLRPVLSPNDRTGNLGMSPVPADLPTSPAQPATGVVDAPPRVQTAVPETPAPVPVPAPRSSAAPIAIAAVLLIALGVGCFFAWKHSTGSGNARASGSASDPVHVNVPVPASASDSASASASASAPASASASAPASASASAPASTSAHPTTSTATTPTVDVSRKMPFAGISQLRVKGRPQPETISRGLHAALPRFRACYETAVKSSPSLKGDVHVEMVVGSEGNVLPSPYVDHNLTTLNDAGLEKCILGVASSLSFPKPESPVVSASCTFTFDMR